MSAIDEMKQAVQILRENVRHEAGILYAGVRDNDKTRKAIVALIGCVEEATSEIEALRRERDGLRADAVRYRWLREKARTGEDAPDGLYIGVDSVKYPGKWALYEKHADKAIDAAMKEQGNG